MRPPSAHRYIFVRVRGDDSTYGSERQYCHEQALNRAFPLVSGMLLEYTVIYIIKCVWYARLLRQMRLLRTRLIRTFPHTVITLPRLLRNARLLH